MLHLRSSLTGRSACSRRSCFVPVAPGRVPLHRPCMGPPKAGSVDDKAGPAPQKPTTNQAAASLSEAALTAAASGAVSPSSSASSAARYIGPERELPAVAKEWEDWNVLVAGATGGVGKEVVSALQQRGVPVRALVRDSSRAQQQLPLAAGGVELLKGDVYQYASLPPAFAGGINAVICCTGATDKRDPFGPFNVDFQGTVNLVAAAKAAGVKHFVLVTSIGTDDPYNPLNLFWGVLFWKKRAEEVLQRSGLTYTIVRPGGLKSRLRDGEPAGNVVMAGPNAFGFPPLKKSGSILRSQVAKVCVEALVLPSASNKVVEVIAEATAPNTDLDTLFQRVAW